MKKTTVLILGATGMLGHTLFRFLTTQPALEVFATIRGDKANPDWFSPELRSRLIPQMDAVEPARFANYLARQRPDVVINCIGLIKQIQSQQTTRAFIAQNAVWPHRLAFYCSQTHTRFIHISTDCVFSGAKGNYREADPPDPADLYGITKQLGEIEYPNCLTLRTSIIGHELRGKSSLVEWFLAQTGTVNGYSKAIYSGFPTIELAQIIANHILPDPELTGLLHLSSCPVTKYDLLELIRQRYAVPIQIMPVPHEALDRSLDSTLFKSRTGYQPPSWSQLVDQMYRDYQANPAYHAIPKEDL